MNNVEVILFQKNHLFNRRIFSRREFVIIESRGEILRIEPDGIRPCRFSFVQKRFHFPAGCVIYGDFYVTRDRCPEINNR